MPDDEFKQVCDELDSVVSTLTRMLGLLVVALTLIVFLVIFLARTAHAYEPPAEARLYYHQQSERCKAIVSLYDHIDQVVREETLLTLFDFENSMLAKGNIPEELQPLVMEHATIYYNSAILPWQPASDGDTRLTVDKLKQFSFNTCRASVLHDLNEYMLRWEREQSF